ncbi:MAG: hypothetical protein ABFR53_00595 [Actinomycetota bacterium]
MRHIRRVAPKLSDAVHGDGALWFVLALIVIVGIPWGFWSP